MFGACLYCLEGGLVIISSPGLVLLVCCVGLIKFILIVLVCSSFVFGCVFGLVCISSFETIYRFLPEACLMLEACFNILFFAFSKKKNYQICFMILKQFCLFLVEIVHRRKDLYYHSNCVCFLMNPM
jgi:hypothetical protein